MIVSKWLIIFLLGIIICLQVKGQIVYSTEGNPSIASLSARFVEVDSQFYIIPRFAINKKNLKVRIPKKRVYVDGNFVKSADAKISLLKQIGNSYAYITLGKLDYYANSIIQKNEYVNFQEGGDLKDTILLQNIFPLDVGDYIAVVELSFWHGKKKISITSPQVYFKIFHKPKNSIY